MEEKGAFNRQDFILIKDTSEQYEQQHHQTKMSLVQSGHCRVCQYSPRIEQ